MKNKFLVLGGDLRSIKLAEMLAEDENKVYSYGQEKSEEIVENNYIEKCRNLNLAIEKSEFIVAPVPFTSDGVNINCSFSEEKIPIEELLKNNKTKTFFAGSINNENLKKLKEKYLDVIDIMKREELAVLNTIATAEGTIEVAIKNTGKILQGANVLVLGFGRVAKIVAAKFNNLSAKVTVAARKITDLAWIEAYGYNSLDINNMLYDLKDFDIIINTVPQTIIKERELKHMNSDVLLIDLASQPGGIESKVAINMGMCGLWLCHGKVAPITSAKYIKETIYNIIAKM